MVTCYFITVNPNSSRLNEALAYVADLAAYLGARDDLYFLKDFETEPGSFIDQLRGLYEYGEVYFAIDPDVYMIGLDEVMAGEIPPEEYAREAERRLRMYLGE